MFRIAGVAMILAAAGVVCAVPASAKISAMSGAYDGRGKPPETVKPETVKPEPVKPKTVRKPVKPQTSGTGGN